MSSKADITPQTSADFAAAVDRLTSGDAALGAVVEEHGQPEFWFRPPGFPTLVLFILEQQVSLASAAAAFQRLEARVRTVTPDAVLSCSDDELRADGFSRQKQRYVRVLASAIQFGDLDLAALASMPDDEVRRRLTALTGIGAWTADVYLLSCLRRADLWPVGDRALQVATAETLGLESVPDPPLLEEIGERWRPHRSTAARILWHGYLCRRGRTETSVV